ncbi:MAG: diphthamide biosynthesis enzyme Dph2 [Thermoplasmata archaeon]
MGDAGESMDLREALKEIRRRGCKTVGLQYPDGMRLGALEIAEELERRAGVTVMVSAEPTFGACDVPRMPVDLIVQFGHAPMPYLNLKDIIFLEAPMSLPSMDFLEDALPHLGKRVGLLTTVQHIPWLQEVQAYLEDHEREVLVGEADGRIAYAGQLLGCDVHTARSVEDRVDTFLFVGTGGFHPLGVALTTEKRVVVADPFTGEVREMDTLREKVLRQRFAAITLAKEAKTFGIIVSKKLGQYRMALAMETKRLLESYGRKGCILLMDFVGPEFLKGFRVDAFLNTACPRIAIDDHLQYDKPILTFPELEVALGLREWDEYKLDEIEAHHSLG